MLKIILFFVAVALINYFFDRPSLPSRSNAIRQRSRVKIEMCNRIYGDESTRRKDFANCQSNCSKSTDDKIEVCIDACQAIADQFSQCANQGIVGNSIAA